MSSANSQANSQANSVASPNESNSFGHQPVMAAEIVEVFATVPHGVVVDATLGGAGHTVKLLNAYPWMRVLGIDQDPVAVVHGRKLASENTEVGERLLVEQGRFDEIAAMLERNNISQISGALFDLGVSSPQLDMADRGFSYRNAGPLDMRMDTTQEFCASDVVNSYGLDELTHVLRNHADERFAFRISKAIIASRPITDTVQLAEIIAGAIPAPARRTGGHPAKRSFQAIRIEVNKELDILPRALNEAIRATSPGGRIAVLSYHSGEDRIVKQAFRDAEANPMVQIVASPYHHHASPLHKLVRKVRVSERPSAQEIEQNPRAASARLRVIEKVSS
ncbi:MAG: 16S rRNA (cytosine(1402)-N(4))-methyltransferase RsmH [Actinobacteria bacterium]|nr:MAG: 16S rRNA (cytosine(1402)-N(4))-methyltransferase RsmH [Actinomycetota bacterium]